MAILFAKGISHPDAPQEEISFVEAMTTHQHMLEPPSPIRDEVGRKIDACFRLMASHIEAYRAAVIADHGPENAEARISNAVRNSARRAGLTAVLGLS